MGGRSASAEGDVAAEDHIVVRIGELCLPFVDTPWSLAFKRCPKGALTTDPSAWETIAQSYCETRAEAHRAFRAVLAWLDATCDQGGRLRLRTTATLVWSQWRTEPDEYALAVPRNEEPA